MMPTRHSQKQSNGNATTSAATGDDRDSPGGDTPEVCKQSTSSRKSGPTASEKDSLSMYHNKVGTSDTFLITSALVKEAKEAPDKTNNKTEEPTHPGTDEVEAPESGDEMDGKKYINQHREMVVCESYPKEGIMTGSPIYTSIEIADKAYANKSASEQRAFNPTGYLLVVSL
eukprot:2324481-Ditylum_brightwellii.AAC.1